MPRCAYCNFEGPLTREHIIPKSLFRLFEDSTGCAEPHVQFIASCGGKYIDGESSIKDVCAKCNNVTLGKLDAYGNHSFTPQCADFLHPGECRTITYEFDTLLRWLLKIAYNASRAYQTDDLGLIRPYREFIKGCMPRPKRVALFGYGIVPYRLSNEERIKSIANLGRNSQYFYPDLFRISQIAFPSAYLKESVTRGFFFRSILIVVILGPKKMPKSEFDVLIKDFTRVYSEAVCLFPHRKSVAIPSSTRNALDVFEFHASMHPHLYSAG